MDEPGFVGRTRGAYDGIAGEFAEWVRDELAGRPVERGLLDAFAEIVRDGVGGEVADIGCGAGRVTAYLRDRGVAAFGIDLSPGLVDAARRDHPGLRFEVGSMLDLDLPDGGLGGLVAWYSVIHIPDDHLPRVFAEFHRVLAPGAAALLAFQSGDEVAHWTSAAGHPISLDFHHRTADRVIGLLEAAGLRHTAHLVRAPDTEGDFPDDTPQAFVLAHRPADA